MMKSVKFRLLSFAFILCLLFTGCTETMSGPDRSYDNTVTVMNVGQAKSALIQSAGQFVLVDAGFADGQTDIVSYLSDRGVQTVSLMVLTHFHFDHTSEVMDIMRNFDVQALLIPALNEYNAPDTEFYQCLIEDGERGKYELYYARQDMEFTIGDGTLKVLADTFNDSTINDTSVCFTFTQEDFIYLETGDAEWEVEKLLLESNRLPQNVTLFNAAHHGSSDANTFDFMEWINPSLVTISCGKDNDYNHPGKVTLGRFRQLDIPYLITHEHGNIVYSMADKSIIEE